MKRCETRRCHYGAVSGDYGKPRQAVVIQSDFLAETDSVLVCLLTTTACESTYYRVALPAGEGTGLRRVSYIMADKIGAARRDRCGPVIGQTDAASMRALAPVLMRVIGVAD